MKITSLLENTAACSDVMVEHGLSLFIETENQRILFDMGQSDLFAKNAEALGIDLSTVDAAVISHGHYDHGGGLSDFLRMNKKAPVYINKGAFGKFYNGSGKYIGLDAELKNSDMIKFADDGREVLANCRIFSCNDKVRKYDMGSFGLSEDTGNLRIPDNFHHEQYLLIEEKGKRVLFSGCSHKGIFDIVEWFKPDVLVGGSHFSKITEAAMLEEFARRLDEYPTVYYTCHCTGVEQYEIMKKHMRSLHYIACGESICL